MLSIFLIGCASSTKKEAEEVKSIEAQAKSIAHGTAQIDCTIVELMEVNNHPICVAIIDTVFEYGAGTKGKFDVTTKTPEQLRSKENPYAKTGMTVVEFWNGVLINRPDHLAVYNTASQY